MDRPRKVGVFVIAIFSLGLVIHESIHLFRFGHLPPLGLHADVVVTTSSELLGVDGVGKIYEGRLTNYGLFPATITACDYLDFASLHDTMVAYYVERRDPQLGRWNIVTEWGAYGSRLFCRPSFEVTETHLVRRRLWPGESIRVGAVVPAQGPGFRVGDDGRFTIFLGALGDRSKAVSTAPFRIDAPIKTKRTN
jgi:hypothetical protein